MPTTFPSSAPASQPASPPVIERARERRAHYGAGAALIRTAIIHSFNASSRNEWEYRMASNNNNNKSTILLTHTDRQTTQPPHRVRTQTQRAPRAPAAPLRAKGKNWGHWWGERGRQAGRERGREEGRAQRGREWGSVVARGGG